MFLVKVDRYRKTDSFFIEKNGATEISGTWKEQKDITYQHINIHKYILTLLYMFSYST